MSRNTLLTFAGIALACAVIVPLAAQDADPKAAVAEHFQRMAQAQGDDLWNHAMGLEALGKAAAPEIARQLEASKNAGVRLAAAKALLEIDGAEGQRKTAIRAVKSVVQGAAPRGLRVRACNLLTAYGMKNEVKPLKGALERITDPVVKIHLLRALHYRGRYVRARRELRKFLKSDDFGVRAEAALALASPEIGNVELVRPILRKIKAEPSDRGRRAQAYLEQDTLLSKLEKWEGLETRDEGLQLQARKIKALNAKIVQLEADVKKAERGSGGSSSAGAGNGFPGGKMMAEIFGRIREGYVNDKKTKVEDLVDNAARGLVDSLDPFSSYMSERQLKDFNTGMQQRYGGIGAVVQIDRRTGFLSIQQPFYGNPAFKAGIRTLDKIVKVEGTDTKGKSVGDLVKILKGPEGTPVRVLVRPFLGGGDSEKTVIRNSIVLKSVHTAMLPNKIGYLSLQQFGHLAVREVEAGLKKLEGQGMQGLIFDLRGNPGGLLNAAVLIADKFLDDDQLVTYSQGRKGTPYGRRSEDGGPRVQQARVAQPKHPEYPIVILTNEGSASASEIVSGALQAHGRAVLVGETTFGKGSVQNIFSLSSVGGKAALRMTIAYYYLPDGRLIHRSRDVNLWRFLQRMRGAIARWKQDGVITDKQAKEMMDRYENTPGGVEPDHEVLQTELSVALQTAYAKILGKQLVEDYVRAHWNEHKERFHKLAQFDGFDENVYPDFDKLWGEAQKALEGEDPEPKKAFTRNDLRVIVRNMIRRIAQDDLERILVGDYQQDRQLQAGLMVMLDQVGGDLEAAGLGFLKKVFPKGVAKTRKLPAKKGEKNDKKEDKKGEKKGERDFK
jgi:carboxyl-terminal processing protease